MLNLRKSSKSIIKFFSLPWFLIFFLSSNFLYAKTSNDNSEIISVKNLFFSSNNQIEVELSGVAEYKIFS